MLMYVMSFLWRLGTAVQIWFSEFTLSGWLYGAASVITAAVFICFDHRHEGYQLSKFPAQKCFTAVSE